jgi:hypothetical protein
MQHFEENERKLPLFADSHWAILPSLLLADGRYQCELAISQLLSNNPGEFSRGCPITFGHFLYPFSSAQTLSNSLLEHFPVPMGKR